MSKEGAKEMSKAAADLSIFPDEKKKSDRPTLDHLPPEDGPPPAQTSDSQSQSSQNVKAGSFEKLGSLFNPMGVMGARP